MILFPNRKSPHLHLVMVPEINDTLSFNLKNKNKHIFLDLQSSFLKIYGKPTNIIIAW